MSFENPIQNQEKKTEGQIKARALAEFAFNITDPDKRYDAIINENAPAIFREDENNPLGIEVVQKMKQDLLECCKIQDMEKFQERFLSVIEPILNLERENLQEFESLIGKNTMERFHWISINDLLKYAKDGRRIHIHILPAKSMSRSDKLSNLNNGLKDLASIIDNDKDVELVTATSTLVAEHPRIVEKLMGFTIDGSISDETREKYFKYDTREIHEAHMTREDFLNKHKK